MLRRSKGEDEGRDIDEKRWVVAKEDRKEGGVVSECNAAMSCGGARASVTWSEINKQPTVLRCEACPAGSVLRGTWLDGNRKGVEATS